MQSTESRKAGWREKERRRRFQRKLDPAREQAYWKRYYETYREKKREYLKVWKQRNPEKEREYARAHYLTEKGREAIRRAQLRRKNIAGFHSEKAWTELKIALFYACVMCLRQEPEVKLTKDHIVPISAGGTDYIENIQPLCRSCNSRKGAKIML